MRLVLRNGQRYGVVARVDRIGTRDRKRADLDGAERRDVGPRIRQRHDVAGRCRFGCGNQRRSLTGVQVLPPLANADRAVAPSRNPAERSVNEMICFFM